MSEMRFVCASLKVSSSPRVIPSNLKLPVKKKIDVLANAWKRPSFSGVLGCR